MTGVRHQAEQAQPADARYGVWNGDLYRAETSASDGTVLLTALSAENAHEGFDVDHDGTPAKVVPSVEVPHTFDLHTRCLFDDEVFAVAGGSGEKLMLRWTGRDATRAAELGLVAESTHWMTAAAPQHIEALWQERHDALVPPDPTPEPQDAQALLRRIGRTLKALRPPGGSGIAAQFRQVGHYAELEVRAVVADLSLSLSSPPELSRHFSELRAAMYEPEKGSWFQGTFTLAQDNRFDFDYDSSAQPNWRSSPDAAGRPTSRAFAEELRRFPRDRDLVPPWLAARAGLPLGVSFRHARVVDVHTPGERPVVNRPPVPPQEVAGVLNYLFRAPVVLSGEGPQPDLFLPGAPPDVPALFHTDGTWIWPAAVPHYLRKHGVPPELGLLDAIRANGYRPPYVPQRLRETAEADLTGRPYPPQTAEDLHELDAVAEVEREATARPRLTASEVLTVLHKRIDESGIAPEAYRIGEVAEEAWCLRRVPEGWEVAWHAAGRSWDAERFSTVRAAAAHLLGVLTFHPNRTLAGPPAHEAPTDWPIAPMAGEPPMTLFRDRRMVTLAAGAELTRFGTESGNLVHAAEVRFAETSLLPDREHHRQSLRVVRPLRALAAVTLPWGGMPGGAPAFLLPRPVAHHLETGALARLAS